MPDAGDLAEILAENWSLDLVDDAVDSRAHEGGPEACS
jgi:hypothetical protein